MSPLPMRHGRQPGLLETEIARRLHPATMHLPLILFAAMLSEEQNRPVKLEELRATR